MSGAALPPSQSVAPSWSSLGACGPHGGVNGDFREGSLANGHLPGLLPPLPLTPVSSCRPSDPSREGRLSVLWGYRAFPCVLGHARPSLGPPRVASLCPLVLWKSCNQIPWPSREDSLVLPSAFARPPSWEAWRRAPSLHNSGRTSLVLPFSSFGLPTQQVWDLILSKLHPSHHLVAASPLSLHVGCLLVWWVPVSAC